MATREDTEAGWEIFKGADFGLSLVDINDALVRAGFSPVSNRTYRHYHKLQRFGYDYYLPINQLDVKTLDNPFWDQSVRGRYTPLRVHAEVVIVVLVDDTPVELPGTAVQLSDGEAVVRLAGAEAVQFFESLTRTARMAEIIFRETGEILLCSVQRLGLEVDSQVATVRISFLDSEAVDQLPRRLSVDTTILRYEGLGPGSHPMVVVVEEFYWLFQALEGMRVVCQELLREMDPDGTLEVPVTRVLRISHQSPMEVDLETAKTVGLALWAVWVSYIKISKTYWDRAKSKEEALALRWENDRKGIDRRLMPGKVLEWVATSLAERLRDNGIEPATEQPDHLERPANILKRQVYPALRELDQGGSEPLVWIDDAEAPDLEAFSLPGQAPRPSDDVGGDRSA